MRLLGARCFRHLAWVLLCGSVGGLAACSVYEESPPGASAGGTAGTGQPTTTTTAGGDATTSGPASTDTTTSGPGGAGGAGGEGVTVGTAGGAGDSSGGAAGDGGGAGSSAGAGAGGSSIVDGGMGGGSPHDAAQDEGSSPLAPQTLPPHGVEKLTNLAVPFTSACNADEVVIGFNVRAGAWTDAISCICSKFADGMLGTIRILPLNGKTDGGNPQQMLCPTNFVAAGVVGNYGHSNRFNVDQMTGLGVVCREIANPKNLQIVAVTQTPLDSDAGMIAFREDCTPTRYLTSMTGTLDNNAISGQSVVRLGGECNSR
jgi:hypothetical protein